MHRRVVRALFIVTVIGLLAAQAAYASTPPPALPHVAQRIETQQSLRIIAFGSSSTEGIGATTKDHTYPARLQAVLASALPKSVAVTVLNRGIGGQDADDMITRVPAIIAEKPDLVIWQTGSNDSIRGVSPERFVAETRDGIQQMQAAGIDVMLMEPQLSDRLAMTAHADEFRDAVREIGQSMNVLVIRRYDLMRQWLAGGLLTYGHMMSPDGLHMTDGGYDMLARAVAETILTTSRAPGPHVATR
jgi:lysophospholipase L1-like esterase